MADPLNILTLGGQDFSDPLLDAEESRISGSGVPGRQTGRDPLDLSLEVSQAKEDVEFEQARETLRSVEDHDPDQEARFQKMAEESFLPVSLVRENPQKVEALLARQRDDEALKSSPVLRRKLKEPSFASKVKDDIEGLSFWETVGRDIEFGFASGQATRDLGVLGYKAMTGQATPEDLEKIRTLKQDLQRQQGSGGFLESAAKIVGQLEGGLGQSILSGEAGALAGGTAALIAGQAGPQVALPEEIFTVPGAAAAGFATAFAFDVANQARQLEAGHAYLELIDLGIGGEVARGTAEVVGFINGLLEVSDVGLITAPIKAQFRKALVDEAKQRLAAPTRAGAFKGAMKWYLGVLGAETATEIGQEVVGIAGEEIAKQIDPKEFESLLATEEGRAQLADRLLSVAEEVSKGMAVLALPGGGIKFRTDLREVKKAERNQEIMQALGDNAKASKAIQRAPDQVKEFIREATQDGPVKDVHIPAKELAEYFQSQGIGMEAVGRTVPAVREQFPEALAAGGDVVIPLGEYATTLAPTEHHAALARHARFRPEDMTLAEAEDWRATQQDRFNTEAERILQENVEDVAFQRSAQRVFDNVRDQLMATERFAKDVAEQYASLHQAFNVVMADRLGISPFENFTRSGLAVRSNLDIDVQGDVLEQGPRQEVTRTPEFKNFFGDFENDPENASKVVDDQGEPLVVFHGTNKDFEAFDPTKGEFGIHFGTKDQANFMADLPGGENRLDGVNVIPAFLNIKNPVRIPDLVEFTPVRIARNLERQGVISTDEAIDIEEDPKVNRNEKLKALLLGKGIDGFVYQNGTEGVGDSYVAFSPEQIKSVNNRGTFDPNDPRLLFQGEAPDSPRARADRLLDMDAVELPDSGLETIADVKERAIAAMKGYEDTVLGSAVQATDGREFLYTKTGGKKVVSHGADRRFLEFLGNVQSLMQEARWLWSNPHEAASKQDNRRFWHYYGIKARLGGEDYLVRFTLRESVNETIFYDLDFLQAGQIQITEAPEHEAIRQTKPGPVTGGLPKNKLLQWLQDVKRGDVLEQTNRGSIVLGGTENIITLLEGADLSTFLHESGHFFFEQYRTVANQPDAPQAIRDDLAALLNHIGVKDLDTWNAMSLEERRAGHEEIARSFEAYLFTGEAPSNALRESFRRFKAWLVQIYRSLRGLNVNLTPEVKAVFDRMLATEEEIRLARETDAYRPIFENAEQAGMTPREFAEYQSLARDDEERAKELLEKRSLRNVGLLEKAKSRELKRLQRENRAKRDGVRAEVEREVFNRPLYRAFFWLKGRPKPVDPEEPLFQGKRGPRPLDPSKDSLFTAIGKLGGLNKEEVVRQWRVDPKDKFKSRVVGKPVLRAKNAGASIDQMAEELAEQGYLPVDENGKWDLRDFEERFMAEHTGTPQFSLQKESALFDAAIDQEFQDLLADQRDPEFLESLKGQDTGKLSLPALKAMYGEGQEALWRKLPRGPHGMISEGGLHPDLVAELFGFTSGDELVKAMLEAKDVREVIEEETDQRMLELYGDLNDPKAIEEAVNRAVHNDARTRMVHAELRALTRGVGRGNILAQAARDFAKSRIGAQRLRDIRPHQYVSAERRAGRLAWEAMQRVDMNQAIVHKRAQVLNQHFAVEALKAQREAERTVNYLKKFDSAGARKSLDIEYLDQIHSILERYDLKKSVTQKELDRRQSMREWIRDQEEQGLPPLFSDDEIKALEKKHFQELKVDELNGLKDVVRNIEHLGRLKHRLLMAQKEKTFTETVNKIVETVEDHSKGHKKIKRGSSRNKLTLASAVDFTFGVFELPSLRLSDIFREMDGFKDNGFMWETFVLPLNRRTDWKETRRREAMERLSKIFSVYSKEESKRMHVDKYIREAEESLNHWDRISIALNWGNAQNRQRIMGGDAWNFEQVQAIFSELTKKDWDFVQSVWDFINEFWPEIEQKERRVAGVAPQKVQPVPVETPFGIYRGGYFPIVPDPELSERSFAFQALEKAKEMMKGAFTRATTRRGHTKQRAEKVNRQVLFDLAVIGRHVDQVLHDLAYHEYLVDANRLLGNQDVQEAIKRNYGTRMYRLIQDHLSDIAVSEFAVLDDLEKVAARVRNGATVAVMAFNVETALKQVLGLTTTIEHIGAKWTLKGIRRFFRNPEKMVRQIYEASPFMAQRADTINREIRDIMTKIDLSKRRLPFFEFTDKFGFFMIQKFQMMVDVPTWLGAYEKAIDSGIDRRRAIALADQAVKDTQGSGHVADLARIQRGNVWKKLWTNFMSYFVVLANRTREARKRVDFRDPLSIMRFVGSMFMLFTAPVILELWFFEALAGGECDSGRDLDCMQDKFIDEQISYPLGMYIATRDLGGFMKGYDFSGPPGAMVIKEGGRLVREIKKDEIEISIIDPINRLGGIVFHYPAGQIDKTVEGFIALESGETSNPAALFVGPPRTGK